MTAVGSRDGREIVLALEPLRASGASIATPKGAISSNPDRPQFRERNRMAATLQRMSARASRHRRRHVRRPRAGDHGQGRHRALDLDNHDPVGDREGLLQAVRHQRRARESRHRRQLRSRCSRRTSSAGRRRHLGRLLQCAGEEPAGHDGARPRHEPDRAQPDAAPRPQGPDQQLRQLKGKIIATNGQGAVSTYEVGKMLETDGLTINDVDIKVIPFTQYALAFNNKAIDAAIAIPPFTAQLLDGGHAVNFAEPRRARQTAPDDDRGQHDQHRLGEGQPRAGAQLLCRLSARHPRLLPSLSRRRRSAQAFIDLSIRTGTETRPELLAQLSLAGAQPGRPDQCRRACSTCRPGT